MNSNCCLKICVRIYMKDTFQYCHCQCHCHLKEYQLFTKFTVFQLILLVLEDFLHFPFGTATMRFIRFAIFVCIFSISFQNGSCSFIGDAIQQGFHTALGFIKDIPHKIPTPHEVFEFGKNVLFGLPMELTINVVHEFCKYSLLLHN